VNVSASVCITCACVCASVYLVERARPGQDDVGVVHLDGPLAQTHQVRPDANGPARHLGVRG
jgi:nucleotidyltransferase/DNA polymerase involved in DNA repair